jgi:2-oxoisovalerate dehydrogenase E2 component (dihydrolipoyl transacylase)
VQAELDELPPWERPGTGDLFKPSVEYSEEVVARPTTMMTRPPGLDFSKRNLPLPAQPERTNETLPSIPSITPAASNIPGELLALTTMRRAVAQHMVHSEHSAPHVTTIFEVDLSGVVAHREAHKEGFARQGINLTYTAYFVAACAAALREYPTVNSRWTDEGIYVYNVINIGMATALDDGLIVPVVRNAGDYALPGLARLVNDLAERARSRQLKPDEVRDGTFTITNHGVTGSLFATPIINQPQTAILGVGAIEKRVKVINDMIAIRPCAYLSLTFDHRVLDGAKADHFVAAIKQTLEQWA